MNTTPTSPTDTLPPSNVEGLFTEATSISSPVCSCLHVWPWVYFCFSIIVEHWFWNVCVCINVYLTLVLYLTLILILQNHSVYHTILYTYIHTYIIYIMYSALLSKCVLYKHPHCKLWICNVCLCVCVCVWEREIILQILTRTSGKQLERQRHGSLGLNPIFSSYGPITLKAETGFAPQSSPIHEYSVAPGTGLMSTVKPLGLGKPPHMSPLQYRWPSTNLESSRFRLKSFIS